VLIGLVLGGIITFAFQAKAERVTYIAEPEEPVVIQVRIETEEEKIERLITEEFVDAPVMVAIAKCESEFKNVPGRSSNDFGPFQVNYVHLEELEALGLDRTVVEDNITFARILYERNGTRDWNNSRECWSRA
jgi:hypothetical protein